MDTIDLNYEINRESLEPLKSRWNFLAISVAGACILSFYYFWAYSYFLSIFTKLPYADGYSRNEMNQYFFNAMADIYVHITISGLLFFAAQVCSVIAVCMFFHRATKNLYRSNIQALNYTPAWSVGWFFIPFVQLVMPLLVANQLWKASVSLNENSIDKTWQKNPISPWIIIWYISFIGSIVFIFVYAIIIQASTIRSMGNLSYGRPFGEAQAFAMMQEMFSNFKTMFFIYGGFWVIQGAALILWTKKVLKMQTT